MALCVTEAKWMVCHLLFPACVYDKSAKSFRKHYPCQETCDLYLGRAKSCWKIWFQLSDLSQGINVTKCIPARSNLRCSWYAKKSSGICQDKAFSNQLCCRKSIVFSGFPLRSKSILNFSLYL